MKTRQFTYKQRAYLSEEEFNVYKNKYIEKLNKRKKVVKVEDKTLGDYIKNPIRYSDVEGGWLFDTDIEDILIEINNPDHVIGTLFTYEDGSQKFAFYNAWGPKITLSGKDKGLVIGYYMSNSFKDKHIYNVIVSGWLGNKFTDLYYPGIRDNFDRDKYLQYLNSCMLVRENKRTKVVREKNGKTHVIYK